MGVNLFALRTLQLCSKPLQGKGLGYIPLMRQVNEFVTSLVTPQNTRVKINGYKMMVNMRMGGIARCLAIDHSYESLTTQLFINMCQKLSFGDAVIDVGANIGYYSLLASTIHLLDDPSINLKQSEFNCHQVFAIEPNQDNLYYFYRNIVLNRSKNITVIPFAASDKNGAAFFNESEKESSEHSLFLIPSREINTVTAVHTMKLDDIISHNYIGLIKVDTEGAEINVLLGAKNIINRNHPTLIIECWEEGLKASNHTVEDMFDLLGNYGYKHPLAIDEFNKRTLPASPNLVRDYFREHKFSINLYCEANINETTL